MSMRQAAFPALFQPLVCGTLGGLLVLGCTGGRDPYGRPAGDPMYGLPMPTLPRFPAHPLRLEPPVGVWEGTVTVGGMRYKAYAWVSSALTGREVWALWLDDRGSMLNFQYHGGGSGHFGAIYPKGGSSIDSLFPYFILETADPGSGFSGTFGPRLHPVDTFKFEKRMTAYQKHFTLASLAGTYTPVPEDKPLLGDLTLTVNDEGAFTVTRSGADLFTGDFSIPDPTWGAMKVDLQSLADSKSFNGFALAVQDPGLGALTLDLFAHSGDASFRGKLFRPSL